MSDQKMAAQKESYSDIDRGWAWVVMVTSYLGMIVYCVTLYMNGILYIALLDRYGEGETKTSLVGAVSSGLLCFSAPLGSIINNKFSCRVAIVMGGILTTLGFALSAFVPNLNCMIFTSGALVGLGYGISSSGLICVVGFYFEKRRDLVLSFAFLTVGVAMFFSAPFGLYLIGTYGLTATFLILACLQAQMCVLGVLSRPSVIERQVHNEKKLERARKESSSSKTYIDLSLLKNVPYLGFLCSTATWNFGLTVGIMHLPNYIKLLGGADSDIGYVLSSFSIANLVGRLLGSLTISKLHYKSIYVQVLLLAIAGVLSSLFPFYSKITGGVYIFTIQLGVFVGIPNAMMTPLSLSFVGLSKLSEAYSLAYVFCGIGVTTGPVLIGYLYSVSKSYEYSFVLSGGVFLLGCLCAVVTICTMRKPYNETNIETIVVTDEKLTKTMFETDNDPHRDVVKPLINSGSRTSNLEIKHRENSLNRTEDCIPETKRSLINSRV